MSGQQDQVNAVIPLLQQRVQELGAIAGDVAAQVADIQQVVGSLQGIDWGQLPPPPPPPVMSIVSSYNTEDNFQSINAVPSVETWRKRKQGGYLVLQWGHEGWDKFNAAYTKPGWPPCVQVPILAHTGRLPILRIPFFVNGGNDLDAALRGDYDQYHVPCAKWIASQPWTTPIVISGNKEADQQGLPYYYGDTDAQRGKWWQATARIANLYVKEIEAAHLGKTRFAFCVTKRTPEAEWQSAIPDLSLVQCPVIKAPDIYCNEPGIDTADAFKNSVLRFAEPKFDWAKKKGLQIGIPEWAVTKVDQPGNVQRWLDYLYGLGSDFVLFEHYYGTGPRHALYGQTSLPKSAAAYVEWMQGHG